MNVQIPLDFMFKTLEAKSSSYENVIDLVERHAADMAVDDFGKPLPYITEIDLVGGICNALSVIKHVDFRITIKVFHDEREKQDYLNKVNNLLTNHHADKKN